MFVPMKESSTRAAMSSLCLVHNLRSELKFLALVSLSANHLSCDEWIMKGVGSACFVFGSALENSLFMALV